MRGWADVGLWVAVCFLGKISLHRPTCKTMFALLTQSQATSQSFRVFITSRSMRDTTFSHFSKLFLYKITVSFPMVIKKSPGGEFAGGGRSTSKTTCVVPTWNLTAFGDRSASSMSKYSPAWTLTSEMVPLGTKSVTFSMLIDLLTCRSTCRSTQVKIYLVNVWSHQLTTDLKRCLLFLGMLALVESESCFGAYVCNRRPAGLHSN